MTLDFQTLKTSWLHWQAAHPRLAKLVVVVESAAVGAAVDVLAYSVDLSDHGLRHAATLIGTAVVVAVRNYVKGNAGTLRQKLDAQ